MNDHLNWIREVLEQQRRWQEQIRMVDTHRLFQEQLRYIRESDQRWLTDIERLTAISREPIKQIDRVLSVQREPREQIEKLLAAQPRIYDIIQQFQSPLLECQEHVRRLLESQSFKRVIELALEPQRQLREEFTKFFERPYDFGGLAELRRPWEALAGSYLDGFDPESMAVDPSGNVVFGNETIAAAEIAGNLEQLAETLSTAKTPVEYLGRLTSFLRRLKRPVAVVVFYFVVYLALPYIVNILGTLTAPLYEEWWKQLTNRPRREIATAIRESALQAYDSLQLQDYRFVIAKRLRVRAGNGRQHKIIGELPLGKVVKVLLVEKNFSLVEYFDETQQNICKGWVASAYLRRFTK